MAQSWLSKCYPLRPETTDLKKVTCIPDNQIRVSVRFGSWVVREWRSRHGRRSVGCFPARRTDERTLAVGLSWIFFFFSRYTSNAFPKDLHNTRSCAARIHPRPSPGHRSTLWEAYVHYDYRFVVATQGALGPNGRPFYTLCSRPTAT